MPYRLTQYLDQLYGKTHDPAALDDAIKISRWGVQISASTVWEILKASGVDPARRSGRVGLTCITKNGSDGSSSPSATRRAPFTVHLRLPSNHKSCYTAGGATLEGKDGQDETGHISVAVRYSK